MTTPNTEGAALTDDWIFDLGVECGMGTVSALNSPRSYWINFARAIESAVRAQGAAEKESAESFFPAIPVDPITDAEQAALYNFTQETPHYAVVRKLYRAASAAVNRAARAAHSAEPPADALGHQVERCGEAVRRQDGYTEPTEAMIVAGARMLCKISAGACQVDEDDNWKTYGEHFIDDSRDCLTAALAASLPNTAAAPLPAKTPEPDKPNGVRIGEGEQT